MRRLERIDRIALVACLAVGIVVRVLWIGADDLWSDEVHTLRTMELPLADVTGERLHAGHVPLYFLLLRAWTALFGVSAVSLRLPSALAGAALLLPAFSLLRRLVPGSAARWGLVLLAVHPVFVELSREARMYSLLGLAFFVLADGAVAALDTGRVPRRLWIAAATGPFVHPSWGFAAAPLALWIAWEARGAGGDRATGASQGPAVPATTTAAASARAGNRAAVVVAASVALLVVLLLGATPQHQELTRRPWARELLVFLIRPFVGSDLRPDLAGIVVLALVGWAACLWRGNRETAPRAMRFAMAMGVGVPLASVASGAIGGVPWGPVRYVHLAAAGFVVLACLAARHTERVLDAFRAAGGANVVTRLRADWIGVPWLAAALLVLLASRASHPRTAWSDAAAAIRDRLPPAEPIWVDDEGSRLVLEHYLGRPVHVGRPEPTGRAEPDGRPEPVVGAPPAPAPDTPSGAAATPAPAGAPSSPAHWRVSLVPARPDRPWELVRTTR